MVQTLGLSASNDIYVNPSGNIQVDTALQALVDICLNVSKALLGEMVLTVNNGLPYFQAVFTGVPNLAVFQTYLINALNGIDGVNSVQNVNMSLDDNVLSFTATISTIYGPTTLANSLSA
jgi:endoglucanase Acf2